MIFCYDDDYPKFCMDEFWIFSEKMSVETFSCFVREAIDLMLEETE